MTVMEQALEVALYLTVAADAALEVGASGDALRRDDCRPLQDQAPVEQVGAKALIEKPLLGLPLDQDEPPLHRAHRGRPPSTFLSHSSPSEYSCFHSASADSSRRPKVDSPFTRSTTITSPASN